MKQTMTMSDGNIIVNCDEPINGYQQFVFSPETIASWTALLGLGSTTEAVAAIMQGVEDTTRYDPSTGRGVWTEAYEALEAALNDTAADMSMLSDDGTIYNDPLTAARNNARKGMHLPTIPKQSQSASAYALEDSDTGTGIDTSCVDTQALSDLLSNKPLANAIDNAEESFYASLIPQTITK